MPWRFEVTDSAQQEEVPFGYEKLTLDQVRALAQEGATKSAELVTRAHLSLTGASGKVGLYFDQQEQQWYLPIGSGGRLSVDETGRSAFQDAAREIGLGQRIAMQHFDALADRFEAALRQTADELTEQGCLQATAIAEEILTAGGISRL